MGMPEIPEGKYRPTLCEVIIDLFESIALEEMALSNILNAESDKIQAFVGEDLDFPTDPSNREIINFSRSVNQFMENVIMNEWLLIKKLENVMRVYEEIDPSCEEDDET